MPKSHNHNRDPRHVVTLVLSLVLLASIILVQGSVLLVFAQTVNTDDKQMVSDPSYSPSNKNTAQMLEDIDEMKKRLEEINQQIIDSNNKILDSQLSIEAQLTAIATYDSLIESYQESILKVEEIIAKYDELIAAKEDEIAENQKHYDEHYNVFKERLRQTYEEGTPGILEIFFTSDSFIDMLTSLERASDVLAYDTSLMDRVVAEKKVLDKQKQEIVSLKQDQEREKEIYLERVAAAEAKEQESIAYIQMLQSNIETQQAFINMTESEEQQIHQNINVAIEELKKVTNKDDTITKKYKEVIGVPEEIMARMEKGEVQKGSEYYANGAEHIWPVEMGYFYTNYFTSAYGRRTITINGVTTRKNHNGIDIGVPRNTEIYASRSGTVVTAAYSNSYGNYIVILHDDGSRTLYAHATKLYVVKGEYVFQGEHIAGVGMTGVVTGYHLHYEYRDKNNELDNPVDHMIMPPTWKNGTVTNPKYYKTHF